MWDFTAFKILGFHLNLCLGQQSSYTLHLGEITMLTELVVAPTEEKIRGKFEGKRIAHPLDFNFSCLSIGTTICLKFWISPWVEL
uniref:Uncharacterized protein n=1 Tax=Rhizophora mucronata TaxID=61149 RepID=A0A2P2P0Z9_RHIMU